MKTRYTTQGKERFFRALQNYREALASKDSRAIVITSIAVHSAKALVPKCWHSAVNRAFKEATTPCT